MAKNPIKTKRNKLWKIVSLYIRTRDSKNGYGQCFTCGAIKPIKELDAGHFIPKTSRAIEYDETNIHAQCIKCNRYLSGNIHEYFVKMEQKYGRKVVDELLTHRGETKKWTELEIDELICYYQDKLKQLEGEYDI